MGRSNVQETEIAAIIHELEDQGLHGIKTKMDKENPMLLAAEFGCYKILKFIVELGDEKILQQFDLDDCDHNGNNILHLGKFKLDRKLI